MNRSLTHLLHKFSLYCASQTKQLNMFIINKMYVMFFYTMRHKKNYNINDIASIHCKKEDTSLSNKISSKVYIQLEN